MTKPQNTIGVFAKIYQKLTELRTFTSHFGFHYGRGDVTPVLSSAAI